MSDDNIRVTMIVLKFYLAVTELLFTELLFTEQWAQRLNLAFH